MKDKESDGVNSSTGASLSRRSTLLGGGSLVVAGLFGDSRVSARHGTGRQPDPEPEDGGGGSDAVAENRKNIWMAQHREHITDKPEDRRLRRYMFSSNTSLKYIGSGWTDYGNPKTGEEASGAWQYTFKLNSIATTLVPKNIDKSYLQPGSGQGYSYDVDKLIDWPSERGTDWVPATTVLEGNRFPYTAGLSGNAELAASELASVIANISVGDILLVRSVGEDSTNIAVSARRDADLFGFLSQQGIISFYAENPEIANSYAFFDPDRITTVNLAEIKSRLKESRENIGAATTLGNILIGEISSKAGRILTFIDAISAINELLDNPELNPLEAFEGFKQVRSPRAGSTGHGVLFDIYCAPGERGEFKVESHHPVDEGSQLEGMEGELPERIPDIRTSWVLEIDAPPHPGNPDDPSVTPSPPTLIEQIEADDENTDDHHTFISPSGVGLRPPSLSPQPPLPGIHIPEDVYDVNETIPIDAYDTARAGAPLRSYEWIVERNTTERNKSAKQSYESTDYSGTGIEYTPTISEPGKYRVTVEVTDANDLTGRTQTSLFVQDSNTPVPKISVSHHFPSPGEDITFTAITKGDVEVVEWTWVLPLGPFEDNYTLPSKPTGKGNIRSGKKITERFPYTSDRRQYEIKLIAEGVDGQKASTTYELAIAPEPYLNIWPVSEDRDTESITVDEGDHVAPFWEYAPTFEVSEHEWSTTGEKELGYQSRGSGNITPVSIGFDEPGDHYIELWVADSTGASAVDRIDVTVEGSGGGGGESEFVIEQGDRQFEVTPLSNGQTIEEFYDSPSGERARIGGLGRSDTSQVFLWDGPDGPSLVFFHDTYDDGSGGACTFDFDGLPVDQGEWVVKDDDFDFQNSSETSINWAWKAEGVDGGAFQGPIADNRIVVTPSFNDEAERSPPDPGEITEWQFLSGTTDDASDPERIDLDLTEPVVINGDIPDDSADPARFYDDFEDGNYTGGEESWREIQRPDDGDFDAEVVQLGEDEQTAASGSYALSVTETEANTARGGVAWQNLRTGWDGPWRMEGLFYTSTLSMGQVWQTHGIEVVSPEYLEDPQSTQRQLTVPMGFKRNDEIGMQINGELIDSTQQTGKPEGGWESQTWYRYELQHDGSGTFTGRVWKESESRPEDPVAESTGSPPGTGELAGTIWINGAGDTPFVVDHDFMEWTPTGEEDDEPRPTGFTDDFDYPASELSANGWTTVDGAFTTEDSLLKSSGEGSDGNADISHEQSLATGTFEFDGIENTATFYGWTAVFISDNEQQKDARGYRLLFRQERRGEVKLQRLDGADGATTLATIDDDHGGETHDVRVVRDPETYAFTVYYDGKEVVSGVEDSTYTSSSYLNMQFDDTGSQSIDSISVSRDT